MSETTAPPPVSTEGKAKKGWASVGDSLEKGPTSLLDTLAGDIAGMAKGDTTHTGIGATFAKRMGREDRIGDPTEYMSTPDINKHLEKFKEGGHAFISEWVHGQIMKATDAGGWGGWGKDMNFVAPLSEAEALVQEAHEQEGIKTIEERLGIPAGRWRSKDNVIYRYILKSPSKFGLRLANGRESGAYKDEWVAGGKTLGGASEAVVTAMGLADIQTAVSDGSLEVRPETFPNTPPA